MQQATSLALRRLRRQVWNKEDWLRAMRLELRRITFPHFIRLEFIRFQKFLPAVILKANLKNSVSVTRLGALIIMRSRVIRLSETIPGCLKSYSMQKHWRFWVFILLVG